MQHFFINNSMRDYISNKMNATIKCKILAASCFTFAVCNRTVFSRHCKINDSYYINKKKIQFFFYLKLNFF